METQQCVSLRLREGRLKKMGFAKGIAIHGILVMHLIYY